ncbi:MAG: O-antigen ligase family protein [Acidobacteria bacterium]|nr:O-antigen ligase family protein [Acidobacteriota bacterium]
MTTMLYGAVHPPVIAGFYVIVASMTVLFTLDGTLKGSLRISRSNLQLPLVLLGLYAVIQIIPFGTVSGSDGLSYPRTISLDPFSTQLTALHLFVLAAFFCIALSCLDSATRMHRLRTFLIVFGFGYSFYAILQSVLSPDAIFGIYKPLGRPFGSFVNKHDFAAVIEMLIALPLGMLFSGAVERDKKMLYIVAIALMGAALLLSGSRGGFVAFFVEVVVLVVATNRAKGSRGLLLKISLSALLLIGAIGGAIFVGGETTLTRIAAEANSQDVSANRFKIWATTLEVIKAHTPFGAGLGAFQQAYTKFDPDSGEWSVQQAHNDYLQIAADAGLVGVALGATFLFLFVRQGRRSTRVGNVARRGAAAGSFAGCVAILTHSLFDFVLHITAVSVLFLTLLAMLVAADREFEDDVHDPISSKRKRGSVTPISARG